MVLDKDQKIWLKVTATYPAEDGKEPDQLKVGKEEINIVSGTGTTNNLNVIDVTGSVSNANYAVVKFTAIVDGEYTFKGTDANIRSLYIYSDCALTTQEAYSEQIDSGDDSSNSCTVSDYTMSAGDTVYLKISLSADSTNLSLTVSDGTGSGGEEPEEPENP